MSGTHVYIHGHGFLYSPWCVKKFFFISYFVECFYIENQGYTNTFAVLDRVLVFYSLLDGCEQLLPEETPSSGDLIVLWEDTAWPIQYKSPRIWWVRKGLRRIPTTGLKKRSFNVVFFGGGICFKLTIKLGEHPKKFLKE